MCLICECHGVVLLLFFLNGVEPNGILFPFLYNMFLDDTVKLEHVHAGCYVGSLYNGHIAYANDVPQLAPC